MKIRFVRIAHQGLCGFRGERFMGFLSHDKDLEDPVEATVWNSVGGEVEKTLGQNPEDAIL